jgi:methylglyoxal reductase
MEYREIGRSGIQGSAVVLGAWAIGGWMWGGQDDRDSIRAVHAALDAGINFIDTAPMYGFGHSEEVVGKAISERPRGELIIATKCGLHWEGPQPRRGEFHFASDEHGIQTPENARYQVYKYLGADGIRQEIEESLRRLGVEYIDLYQTHWQDGTTPISETMETLVRLRDEGKIRAIGVSNAKVEQIQSYIDHGRLDSDQEKYSMLDRKLESSNLPFCRKRRIGFLAYSPLANGLLTGKIGPDREFVEGDLRRGNPRFSLENRKRIADLLESFQPIADSRGINLAQLVIAWTLAQPGVTHALVGIRNEEQAIDNARAGEVRLTSDELDRMNAALTSFRG